MKLSSWLKRLFPTIKTINLFGKRCDFCTDTDIAYLTLYNTTTGVQLGEKSKTWITCATCTPAVEKMLRNQFACIYKSFPVDDSGCTSPKSRFWEPD